MRKSQKTNATDWRATNRKEAKRVIKEKETARLERIEQVARLRALRLAKEADDKIAADKIAKEKAD